ncbi:MAG: helix-turn-helix domain-containing protein [Boseongicola sp.]|nr:MAG: helix-turn-helix domain-containing protein [Boseongicola sp.]
MNSPKDHPQSPRRARGRPRDWHDKSDQNTIKSLDRAMEIFEYLSETSGKPLSALSSEMNQSPATVYRVLTTLQQRQLVEFDATDQTWHIGPQAFVIGAKFLRRTSLVDRARLILRQLMEETGETANLGVEQGPNVLFVSQVETHENIRAFFPPGTLSPLHASGIGKALLANKEPGWIAKSLGHTPLEEFTPQTITNLEQLADDLKVTRDRGYAFDAEEKNLGMRCIAAAVFDMHGEAVAGISVSGPTSRVGHDQIDRLAIAVVDAAQNLTRAIGGHWR